MYAFGLLFTLIFYCIFGGTNYVTTQHGYRIAWAFNFESGIPFVPFFSLVYFSGVILLYLSPFMLRKKRQFIPFLKLITLELVIAAIFFLLLPLALLEHPTISENNFIGMIFTFNDKANLDYNYFPSLHVAFAFTLAFFIAEEKHSWLRILVILWACAVALSTLLTKQHYFVDVIGGMILAIVSYKFKRKFVNESG
jgi:membrane-associated phospholipid phosphatase